MVPGFDAFALSLHIPVIRRNLSVQCIFMSKKILKRPNQALRPSKHKIIHNITHVD